MQFPLLQDIVVILGLSVLIILIFQRLRLPAILGFLITGIICGPHGLSLINAVHEVELLSEIGVIFLLFLIGIEFSLKSLASFKKTIFAGGALQLGGTILVFTLCSRFFDMSVRQSVFMGFLMSLSSTAIVLKLLHEKGEINSPHGRIATAILIFQDLVVVPMMLFIPFLAGETDDLVHSLLLLGAKVAAIIVITLVLARFLVPGILHLVVKTKNKELFILTTIVLCFSTAWLTSYAGLSLALGAFFAGLIISESDYSHQATANILPFREIFISFFFVSIGMLLDLNFFVHHLVAIHLIAFGVMLLKALIVLLAVMLLGYPPRTILLSSIYLFQVGEFAFLLSSAGTRFNLISGETYQYFLAVSIISMGATPFAAHYASSMVDFFLRAPLPRPVRRRLNKMARLRAEAFLQAEEYHDHLVIIGYGINGQNVAKAARGADIPYIIIELDPDIIKEEKKKDELILFGDAADDTVLRHAGIQNARVVVIAVSDPDSTKKIIRKIREFTETAYIIVRVRYVKNIEETIRLGADEVIPEEFETSIEIFTRVLKKYLVPSDEILAFINQIRSHNYEMLRSVGGLKDSHERLRLHIPDMEIAALPVMQASNKIVGKTISESNLKADFGINVLAVKRGKRFITHISPQTSIEQDDVLYIFGSPSGIAAFNRFLKI